MYREGTDKNDVIWGGSGWDDLFGLGGDDVLRGLRGEDALFGGEGNDRLYGGADHDYLVGGAGNDLVDGGWGIDAASYEDAAAGVRVDLTLAGWQDTAGGGTDRLVSIENLYGSNHDDILIGDERTNGINGGPGNDQVFAGGGDDWLSGGSGGADTIDGGDGIDTIDYRYSGLDGVLVGLNGVEGRGPNGEILRNIEDVWGTAGSDTIVGGAGDNYLAGLDGDDRIHTKGNDTVDGGAGNDVFYLQERPDHSFTALGGEGIDQLILQSWPVDEPLTLDLSIEGPQVVTEQGLVMTLSSIEIIWGSDRDETFYAGEGKTKFIGGGGADRFVFRTLDELGLGESADTVQLALNRLGVIDLTAIDADVTRDGDQAFRLLPFGDLFTGTPGEIAQDLKTGRYDFDVDGDRIADASLYTGGQIDWLL